MKRYLLPLAACSLALATQAQSIKIGPRAGATFSSINQDPKQEGWTNNFQTGYMAGLAVNFAVTEGLSFQPEFLFSQKGFKSKYKSDFGTATRDLKANYLEIPMLAKYSFGTGKIKPFVTAGPYFGYWLSGEFGSGKDAEKVYFYTQEADNLQRLDVGFNAGAGVAFDAGPGQLTLDLRYGLSQVSFENEPIDWEESGFGPSFPTSKYQMFSASVAYLYGMKKSESGDGPGFRFGPRAGVNLATTSPDNGSFYKTIFNEFGIESKSTRTSRTGIQGGLVANFGLTETFSIQPEVLFSQKGYKDEITFKDENGKDVESSFEEATNYIEVPVLAKISFGSGSVKPFITAGPYVGYWMGGQTQRTSISGNKETNDIDFGNDSTGGFSNLGYKTANRVDVGASIGAGLGFNIGSGQLNLDVRYGLGINNMLDDPKEFNDPDVQEAGFRFPDQRNQVLGVSVAYLFGL